MHIAESSFPRKQKYARITDLACFYFLSIVTKAWIIKGSCGFFGVFQGDVFNFLPSAHWDDQKVMKAVPREEDTHIVYCVDLEA